MRFLAELLLLFIVVAGAVGMYKWIVWVFSATSKKKKGKI